MLRCNNVHASHADSFFTFDSAVTPLKSVARIETFKIVDIFGVCQMGPCHAFPNTIEKASKTFAFSFSSFRALLIMPFKMVYGV